MITLKIEISQTPNKDNFVVLLKDLILLDNILSPSINNTINGIPIAKKASITKIQLGKIEL